MDNGHPHTALVSRVIDGGKRDGEQRQAAHEVGRPVERVHEPVPARRRGSRGSLLRFQAVTRKFLRELSRYQALGVAVQGRDNSPGLPLGGHPAAEAPEEELPDGARHVEGKRRAM
jgi:hypothetical protein